ncbi:phosphopantetheine--protein transferase [Chromatiales bacterium (ex Bugula neritina AB1)]|nr:phosphopantetheine--protein transferase [Chromatiales bacterium (ex Bugula neritina AB1)]
MKVLAVLSQKGGVGKTTLATSLAVAAEADGKQVALIDLDPQATATFWHDTRHRETPAVVSIQPIRLSAVLNAAREQGTDLAIIDGAAVQREIAYDAAAVSDFVLVPTKPAVFDIKSMTETIRAIQQHDKPLAIVLNMIAPTGVENTDAFDAAAVLGVEICPVTIGNRKSFFRAQGQGLAAQEFEPHGKAAEEIDRLYAYTCIHLYNRQSGQSVEQPAVDEVVTA